MFYTRLLHKARLVRQLMGRVPVGVIGGYHGGNLGDMALGKSVQEVLISEGIDSGLQTIYNLNKWPKTKWAIIGGGAVGYSDSLQKVAQRYKGEYDKVALLGVDFNEKEYKGECLDLINGAAYVSSRSIEQTGRLQEISNRKEVIYHPDLAFSLSSQNCRSIRENSKLSLERKVLMINVVPLYSSFSNGTFIPDAQYSRERPELYENYQLMHSSYRSLLNKVIEQALDEGYVVETIPFTNADEKYGKVIFGDLPVKHLPYNPNPLKMLERISKASWVVSTRFHATIFALKLGCQITPIAYAKKNEYMLSALGLTNSDFISTSDLANGANEPLSPVSVKSEIISKWEDEATIAIQNCIKSLNIY